MAGYVPHVKRSISMASTALIAATVIGGVGWAPSVQASVDEAALNGTYIATSLGNWAKTNYAYHDEETVRSTWTISSTCSTVQDCTGQVTSDQGWSAPLSLHDGTMWYLKRDLPDWGKCPDGSTFTGQQTFYFYPVDAVGQTQLGSPTLTGKDKTVGPSGACRVNKWLVVEMPFRLDKIA